MPSEQLSLSELNQQIQTALENALDPFYWVTAEIAELRVNQRGHCYMELVEKEEEQIKAKIKANIWAFTYRKLSGWFEAITKESLKPGMKILCQVQVQFHPVYGLSLNVNDIDPNYTLGERARNRQEVIDRLMEEGVYDMNKQLTLPDVVQNIAIISSETAAGFGDFINQIRYNEFGHQYRCTLFNATMQGSDARESIIDAMHDVHKNIGQFDALLIIRGGGASLDMDCFDTYDLAYHITQFPLPVITGIGHDRDETIADLVAHTQLKTPTAVAEFLINRTLAFENQLDQLMQRILEYTTLKFQSRRHELELLSQRLEHQLNRKIEEQKVFLEKAANLFKTLAPLRLKNLAETLKHIEHSISLLNPESVLNRGYSITTMNGTLIKNMKRKLISGDLVKTRISKGSFESIVK